MEPALIPGSYEAQQAAAKERMAFAASPEGQRQQAERLQQQQAAQAAQL